MAYSCPPPVKVMVTFGAVHRHASDHRRGHHRVHLVEQDRVVIAVTELMVTRGLRPERSKVARSEEPGFEERNVVIRAPGTRAAGSQLTEHRGGLFSLVISPVTKARVRPIAAASRPSREPTNTAA